MSINTNSEFKSILQKRLFSLSSNETLGKSDFSITYIVNRNGDGGKEVVKLIQKPKLDMTKGENRNLEELNDEAKD